MDIPVHTSPRLIARIIAADVKYAKLHSEEDRNWNSSSKAPHDRNGNPKLGKFKYRPASKMKTKQSQLQA